MFENNFSVKQTNLSKDGDSNRPASEISSELTGGISFLAGLIFAVMLAAGMALAATGTVQLLNNNLPVASNIILPEPVMAAVASGVPDPSILAIPSLNLTAPFEPLGLNSNHTIEVPKNNMGVGWFIYGAKPGEAGAAVIVGHLDSVSGPAIFENLGKIKPGNNIVITRADGSVVTYRVDSISKFSQDNFPTEVVYGPVSYAAVRIITCSGIWDKQAGHYSQNLVVFGSEI